MPRYIDADALIDRSISVLCGGGNEEVAVLVEDIDSAPTIDAVEVVRCKDCIYGKIREVDDKVLVYCDYQFDWWNTDGYCSYGERKDERSRR